MDPLVGRPPSPTQMTAIPKVLGVLSIVFASLVLLFGLFGVAGGAFSALLGAIGKSTPHGEADRVLAPIQAVYGGMGAIGLIQVVMSGLLLAIGIGQLRYRRWARSWSVYWGVAALVCVLGMILISSLVIGPGYRDLFSAAAVQRPGRDGAPAVDMSPLGSLFGGVFGTMFVMLYAPYPILMLAFFTRDRVRAAMVF